MPKRFLLFAGDYYYPSGGWHDLIDSFNTEEEAMTNHGPHDQWAHIVDTETGNIISRFTERDGWT